MKIKSKIALFFILLYTVSIYLCISNRSISTAFAQSDSCTNGDALTIDTVNKRYKCLAFPSSGGLGSGGNVNMTIANASSTGTTANRLAKLTGAPSTALITSTSDTENAVGVCISGCGTTGSATIAILGQVNCDFDNATVAGDYVIISTTTAGKCHDNGATFPNAAAAYGRVLTTNGSSGTYSMELMTPDIAFQNAGNGKSRPGGSTGQYQFNDSNSFNGGPLIREGANEVAQRNGASGQSFNIYRVFNSVSSFERLHLGWDGVAYGVYVDNQAGTLGTSELAIGGNPIIFYTNGSNRWSVGTTGHFTPTGSNGGFNIGDGGHNVGTLSMYKQIVFTNVNDATASEPFISHARVWNGSGVTFQNILSNITNTASAAASSLIDLQVGGTSQFKINKNGTIYAANSIAYSTTTPSIAGNATLNSGSKDSAGKITSTGTGASTAVITFGTAFSNAPACLVTNETTANLVRPISTTTTLTFNATVVTSDSISYICVGY